MSNTCSAGKESIAAQTLFLGASIADFNVNMAWGGRPSQLSVKLVEDNNCSVAPFNSGGYADDHFFTCATNEACYIDEKGFQYNAAISKEKIVPGKVYYVWNGTGFVSRYWYDPDPGFFGHKTCFTHTGTYNRSNYNTSKGFDIINTPVMFRVGNFSFTGLVQTWERSYDSGGLTYDVTIESVDSILDQCYIILDKYAGAVYGKLSTNAYGGPTNHITGSNLSYKGTIAQGNIPNLFNVYGFLESMGINDFGGSKKNDNGISASLIVDALSVLTSSVSASTDPASALDSMNKRAFSPFGRILCKVPQENETYLRVQPSLTNTYGMGLLPITYDGMNKERCHFALDLSELPIAPLDFRISEPVISIMALIQSITTATGVDFYFDVIPATVSGVPYNVLKIRTIYRSAQPNPRQIENTIKTFEDNGYNISSSRIGKEKNTNVSRKMYIGANQQRLYQAKSYRLAFSQSSYIYDSVSGSFVEYYGNVAGLAIAGQLGKIRAPSSLSTRNFALTSQINSRYASLFNIDQDIHNNVTGQNFATPDTLWGDNNLAANISKAGNYLKTQSFTKTVVDQVVPGRFFPLYKDIISPFFGYKMEENVTIQTSNTESNIFQKIRPVWMDSWTGQMVILMDLSELPKTLSVNLSSPFGASSSLFTITESEIRASLGNNGLDSYLTYCVGKTFKPDLYSMLFRAYQSTNRFVVGDQALYDQMGTPANAAGALGQSAPVSPAPQSIKLNLNLFLNPEFLKDFNELYKLVQSIGQNHYGKKYLVRMPAVSAYQDQQYVDISVPNENNMYAYQGTGKIFYSYEPAPDGAWEEFGNIIDDNIVVGSPDWYSLTDDAGKIKPILGFNASDSFDALNHALCNLDIQALSSLGYDQYDYLQTIEIAKSGQCSDPYNFMYPSIDIASLSSEDYILKTSPVAHPDAFGVVRNTPRSSRRLYHAATVEPRLAFMDPAKFRDPRAIVSIGKDIKLRSASKLYESDPNRTVVATAAMEDLCIYLRFDTANHSIDDPFATTMLYRIAQIRGNSELLSFKSSNSNSQFHTISEKAAHPYFAAIPVKLNQACYGPWVNYLDLDKNIIFPDAGPANVSNAVENVVGGIEVEINQEFAPWLYGGMAFLDQAILSKMYSELQYQQIIERATLSIPGLPIFGLGSSFEFNNTAVPGAIGYNGQYYTVTQTGLSYKDKQLVPALAETLPLAGNPVIPAFTEPTINETALNYNILTLVRNNSNSVAPIISSLQCSISPQNVGTTYSFRTYVQRLGFFNKEITDRLKKEGLNNIKTNKEFSNIRNSAIQKLNQDLLNLSTNKFSQNFNTESFNSGFYGTSPGNLLIGTATPFLYAPMNFREMASSLSSAVGGVSDADRTPSGGTAPRTVTLRSELKTGEDLGEQVISAKFGTEPIAGLMKDIRWRTYVGAFTDKEALPEIKNQYNLKSMMSLDGIFSPVSFYPSKYNSTYSLLKYFRKQCPECKGSGILNIEVYNYTTRVKESKEYSCPHCSIKKDIIGSSSTVTANSTEALPPYIITNSNDFNTILEFKKSSSTIGSSSTSSSADTSKQAGLDIPINLISLQPIVVPYGDFRNFNVQNSGTSIDKCRHCIEVVGRGNIPPLGSQGVNLNNNLKTYYNPNDGNLIPNNVNNSGVNIDYYPYDILANNNRANTDDFNYVMNQRFFGIRGPMILHGWGYDTQGYPIPNASDEPRIEDTYGRASRFNINIEYEASTILYDKLKNGDTFVITVPTEDKDLIYFTKRPGIQILNSNSDWVFPADDLPVTKVKIQNNLDSTPANPGVDGFKNLGDIITKQYEHNGTRWVKKERSKQFYLNWAERPDLWPVGPIDLRWDDSRKVWTINAGSSPYKMVYITLEEDLTKENDFDETYPTRGFLDDIEYSKEPLPRGYRRLVYVKDKTGYTAPRGVKLLCKYDTDSGFYEPISKPSVIAQGTIDVGDKAQINMEYSQGNRSSIIPTLLASFVNPLGFSYIQGQKAMFTFLRGQWTLTSISQ